MRSMPQSKQEMEKTYQTIKSNEGKKSVDASLNVQQLASTSNSEEIVNQQNINNTQISQQIKNINNKAFYQSNDYWIDGSAQSYNDKKPFKILFASDEYFDFIKKNPTAVAILSLGKNIRFIWEGKLIEIYE
jgi:hypothetical protein